MLIQKNKSAIPVTRVKTGIEDSGDRSASRLRQFIMLFLLFHFTGYSSPAQEHTPSAVWLLPGVDLNLSEKFRWRNQPGYNHYLRSGLWYSQAYITVSKNLVLNPGYIYLLRKNEGQGWVQEHYLMNAIIVQAGKKDFFVDDRNMIWNRFAVGAEARHYYRNRLRVMQTLRAGKIPIRPYVYDELFFLFNEGKIGRNRVAVGVSSDPAAKLNVDITYIRQWDRYSGSLNLYFVAAIWNW